MKKDKMDEILDAALSLFNKKGYLRTSMTDIANALNLTKGGLYHHVIKKEDLLKLAHERMTDAFIKGFRQSVKPADNPQKKLASWLKEHILLMQEYQPHIKVFFTELDNLKHSPYFKTIVAKRDEIFDSLYDILVEGQQEKIFREDIHPRILTFLIMGMLNWFYQWYKPDGPRSLEKILGDVKNLVFGGVLCRD
ncbi:MAG: TetR/AcrR family transcriptional regulator [Desulfobacterales bacterium]|jgi:AcrR family transcriptional regulator|nr:TetR/AcrR family transcriptional regulator [Desulfobacterales bacterium]